MLTLAWMLLAMLGGVAVLLIVALALPVTIGFELRTSPRWRMRIVAQFLGGVTRAIPLFDSARRRPAGPGATSNSRERRSTRVRTTSTSALRIAAGAPRLATGLLRPIRLRRLAVDGDIGLGDPADTGQFFGLVNTIVHVLPAGAATSVTLRPDFAEPRADGRLDAEIRFVPLAFVPPAVRFAWHVFGRR